MKKTFSIPDMHCSACVMRLEALEDTLAGVHSIRAGYHKQRLEVEWDGTVLSEEDLVKAIQKLGYTVLPASA